MVAIEKLNSKSDVSECRDSSAVLFGTDNLREVSYARLEATVDS